MNNYTENFETNIYPATLFFKNFQYHVLLHEIEGENEEDVLMPSWYNNKIKNIKSTNFEEVSKIILDTVQKKQDFNKYCNDIENFINSLLKKKNIIFTSKYTNNDLIYHIENNYCRSNTDEINELGIVQIFKDGYIEVMDLLCKSLLGDKYYCQFGMHYEINKERCLTKESYKHCCGTSPSYAEYINNNLIKSN